MVRKYDLLLYEISSQVSLFTYLLFLFSFKMISIHAYVLPVLQNYINNHMKIKG